MDVRLSPDQEALRASVARVVRRLGPATVADLDDAERAEKLAAAVESSGWRELRLAESSGIPLASAVEVAIVAEELARGLADVAFLGATLAAELRRLAGAPAGLRPETVAFTEDLAAVAVATAGVTPEGTVALDARGSASALILLPAASGHELGALDLGAKLSGPDLTRPGASVPTGELPTADVGGGPLSRSDRSRFTALGLTTACADLVGTMAGAIDLAAEYAKARRQFGVPVGSFQSVQHLLADARVALEGSRSIALNAAWAVDSVEPDEAVYAASVAKAYCARAARSVCETAIQVHGGIGNTWDCLAHVYLRRALTSTDLLGGVGPCLTRVLEHNGVADNASRVTDGLR